MATYESPTEYIQHHLTFQVKQVGSTSFWSINTDTIVTAIILGILGLGFMWLVTRKATSGCRPSDRRSSSCASASSMTR